jgi:hypothetical protein
MGDLAKKELSNIQVIGQELSTLLGKSDKKLMSSLEKRTLALGTMIVIDQVSAADMFDDPQWKPGSIQPLTSRWIEYSQAAKTGIAGTELSKRYPVDRQELPALDESFQAALPKLLPPTTSGSAIATDSLQPILLLKINP